MNMVDAVQFAVWIVMFVVGLAAFTTIYWSPTTETKLYWRRWGASVLGLGLMAIAIVMQVHDLQQDPGFRLIRLSEAGMNVLLAIGIGLVVGGILILLSAIKPGRRKSPSPPSQEG